MEDIMRSEKKTLGVKIEEIIGLAVSNTKKRPESYTQVGKLIANFEEEPWEYQARVLYMLRPVNKWLKGEYSLRAILVHRTREDRIFTVYLVKAHDFDQEDDYLELNDSSYSMLKDLKAIKECEHEEEEDSERAPLCPTEATQEHSEDAKRSRI